MLDGAHNPAHVTKSCAEMHGSTRRITYLVLALWSLYFLLLWRDMLQVTPQGLVVGWVGVWSDWATHFNQGSAMAYRGPWLTEHPLVWGSPFSYPFISNLISALLVRYLGVPFFSAFSFPSFLFSLLLLLALLAIFDKLLGSRPAALIAIFIFFLNGGLGFVYYLQDVISNPSWQSAALYTKEFTHLREQGIEWSNVITTQLVPQRAFALGFPLALFLLGYFWKLTRPNQHYPLYHAVLAGLCISLFPLIHTHGFFMLCLILLCWIITQLTYPQRKRTLLFWSVFALSAALPLYLTLSTFFPQTVARTVGGGFMRWYPGWFTHPEAPLFGKFSIWEFWTWNWGLVLPLGLLGWLLQPRERKLTFLPFLLIFLLANVVLFQPYLWDNTKVLIWSSLGISALAADVIWRALGQRRIMVKALGASLLAISIFSGALDALLILDKSRHPHTMYTTTDLKAAQFVRENTAPHDVFLTSDVHTNPINTLTGRKFLMGYRGWLWTYGLNYKHVEDDVFTMFRAQPGTEELLKKYAIKYVAFDYHVRAEWQPNETYYRTRYPVFYEDGVRTIYAIQ